MDFQFFIDIIHTIYKMFQLPFIGYLDYDACLIIKRCNLKKITQCLDKNVQSMNKQILLGTGQGGIFGKLYGIKRVKKNDSQL